MGEKGKGPHDEKGTRAESGKGKDDRLRRSTRDWMVEDCEKL